jgi:hypothetical protein
VGVSILHGSEVPKHAGSPGSALSWICRRPHGVAGSVRRCLAVSEYSQEVGYPGLVDDGGESDGSDGSDGAVEFPDRLNRPGAGTVPILLYPPAWHCTMAHGG